MHDLCGATITPLSAVIVSGSLREIHGEQEMLTVATRDYGFC